MKTAIEKKENAFIVLERGRKMNKFSLCDIYNKISSILIKAKCEIKDDLWVISAERDAFQGKSHGCKNFKNGDWEYFPLEAFENISSVSLPMFIKATIGKAIIGE